jgi:acetyl esterase/lipase
VLTRRLALLQSTAWTASAAQPAFQRVWAAADDPLHDVHPEFRQRLREMRAQLGAEAPLDERSLPGLRAAMQQWTRRRLPTPPVRELTIPGPPDAPALRLFLVGRTTGAGSPRPALIYLHGGGYVAGSAAMEIRGCQEIAMELGCVVLAVDYRLAPETRYPGAVEDCLTALRWLTINAEPLGIDSRLIAIKGDSAGGGLAAAVALAARDRGQNQLMFQVLIYPMLDDRTGSAASNMESTAHTWTTQQNRFGWSSYLGVAPGSDTVPAGAVPARVDDLAGLPPAFIGTGSLDLFAAENLSYAQRLTRAGVSTELLMVPGAFHGFDVIVPDAPQSRAFRTAWLTALRRAWQQ